MKSKSIMTAVFTASVSIFSGCGQVSQPTQSEIQDHIDTPTDLIAPASITQLIATVQAAIVAGRGDLPVGQIANVMPLKLQPRQKIVQNFPAPMQLVCQASSNECDGQVTGAALSVQMNFTAGLISDPMLDISDEISTRIKLRGSNENEFCDLVGMQVRKFFIVKDVEGLNLTTPNNRSKLIVDAGDESDNFTCE